MELNSSNEMTNCILGDGSSSTVWTHEPEYYPSFSPDDAFVAFTRVAGNGNVYSNADAEVFVVPASGGSALRLAANDAPDSSRSRMWPAWSSTPPAP